MPKVTMQEISKLAGVSPATVSRALHSPHLVRKATRERITRVMQTSDYVYNATAADLSRRRSTTIGVIIPTTRSLVFSTSLLAIQEAAQENNYTIMAGSSKYDSATESALISQFQERRLAGVILTGFLKGQQDLIRRLVRDGMPCIVIWDKLDDPELSYVGFDNHKATYSITDYLIGLRHRRIGLIIGPFSKVDRVRRRLEGFLAALKDHAIPHPPELIIEKEPTLIDGKEAMTRLMSMPHRPTAVLAASDTLAIGAMAAARDLGLRIPEDVSIAGFDDIDIAAYCNPPLTTVRVPAYEIGRVAVKVILDMARTGSLEAQRYCLDTGLIIRQSCRKLKRDEIQ
jgi:DNA-binding LacI/PurR family transcriptional regulator